MLPLCCGAQARWPESKGRCSGESEPSMSGSKWSHRAKRIVAQHVCRLSFCKKKIALEWDGISVLLISLEGICITYPIYLWIHLSIHAPGVTHITHTSTHRWTFTQTGQRICAEAPLVKLITAVLRLASVWIVCPSLCVFWCREIGAWYINS